MKNDLFKRQHHHGCLWKIKEDMNTWSNRPLAHWYTETGDSLPVHNVLFGQYLFLATERNEINTTHPNYDIIQHILIPSRSVARKTPFMQFFKNFASFTLLILPLYQFRGIFTPVATTGE